MRYLLIALFLISPQVFAQEAEENPPLVVQRFEPTPAPEDFLVTFVLPEFIRKGYTFGVFSDIQQNPLAVRFVVDGKIGEDAFQVVGTQIVTHFVGSVSLFPFLEIGFGLPLVVLQNGEGLSRNGSPGQGVPTRGLGDPKLHVRSKAFTQKVLSGTLSLGGVGSVSIPLGNETGFMGEKSLTGTARLVGDYRWGPWQTAVNLGYRVRQREEFFSLTLDDEILYTGAASYEIVPGISAALELYGGISASKDLRDLDSSPLEADLAIRLKTRQNISLTGGAGLGLIAGAGAPDFRIFAGIRYRLTPPDKDTDQDGIKNSLDRCPKKPENINGREDDDGCPEEEVTVANPAESIIDPNDEDADGVINEKDACPVRPEDNDGFEDDDGCPEFDNDQDGLKDSFDFCPNEAEDKDNFEDDDGCPDNDNDQDEIEDQKDSCPMEAEDMDGLADEDGCPETDADQDGAPDEEDTCPDVPETFNGNEDEDGCPDEGESALEFPQNLVGEIKGGEKISFQAGKSQVTPESIVVLGELVSRMKAFSKAKLLIQSHPKNMSTKEKELAKERAEALQGYLIAFGVEAERVAIQVTPSAGVGVTLSLE